LREVQDEVGDTRSDWRCHRFSSADGNGNGERGTGGTRYRRAGSIRHFGGPGRLRPGLASDQVGLRTRPPLAWAAAAPLAWAAAGPLARAAAGPLASGVVVVRATIWSQPPPGFRLPGVGPTDDSLRRRLTSTGAAAVVG